ncbi:polysaccharide biosynthesis tyrosine autokinase [Curtobacterium sp. Leaf261]|uniref:polysaccharide biosynthesis tyrosine autokinase n=1 Tax=Curtobacterium sp. Leaf261 TaxID=1736311 RepID=UPI0006FD5D3B|nr:polysaccharide biosynthesis tyrosine autokinase [Curtobacterium sp. Leaf261]KQO61370.1 chromosome partitioning protein [Curtobacterium sp. Leaf261]
MDLIDYAHVLRKNLLLLIATTLVGMGAAGGIAAAQTPTFTATTELYVSVRFGSEVASVELADGSAFARQAVLSFIDVVDSEVVLGRAEKNLDFPASTADLAKVVRASSPANTVVVEIAADDADPAHAAAIANAVGKALAETIQEDLEAPAGGGPSRINVKTIQPAPVPSIPSAPEVELMIAIGAALGLALGVTAAMLRTVLDTRIRRASDLEEATRLPILGTIGFDPDAAVRPLVVHEEPRSPKAEAFRRLRTSLQFLNVGDSPNTFLVTSSTPSEGKTYMSANIALALAETGASVVLVDADLRRPRVAQRFGVEGGAGLTDLLIGRAEFEDVIQPWGTGGLSLLASGRVPPNPSELLGSVAMEETVRALEAAFDYVVIDAPPVLVVTDATVLSRLAGVLLVAAANKVRKPELVAALRVLEGVSATVHGAVATMLPSRGPDADAYAEHLYYGEDAEIAAAPVTRGRARRGVRA